MKQTDELLAPLPCPFCGEVPKVTPSNPKLDGDAWGAVQCCNKKCHIQPRADDVEILSGSRGSAYYKNVAIRIWNTRAKP